MFGAVLSHHGRRACSGSHHRRCQWQHHHQRLAVVLLGALRLSVSGNVLQNTRHHIARLAGKIRTEFYLGVTAGKREFHHTGGGRNENAVNQPHLHPNPYSNPHPPPLLYCTNDTCLLGGGGDENAVNQRLGTNQRRPR